MKVDLELDHAEVTQLVKAVRILWERSAQSDEAVMNLYNKVVEKVMTLPVW